jgi:cyclase
MVRSPPPSTHYDFERVGDRIHAAIAKPDGYAICNSGLVDLGDGSIVFDSGMTPIAAADLNAATVGLTGKPATMVANSHWHLDHTLGNSGFAGVPVWGTRRTREILLERSDELTAELQKKELEAAIHELESHLAKARSKIARQDLEFILHINRSALAAAGALKLRPPDQTFETQLTLPGSRHAELRSFGAAHTEADAVFFLPQEKILFSGDLVCVGVQPSMMSGNPDHWPAVLDEIERLRPERIVPGHGPVCTTEGMEETRSYVAGVMKAAAQTRNAPVPAGIRRWDGSLSLKMNVKFAREWIAKNHPRR